MRITSVPVTSPRTAPADWARSTSAVMASIGARYALDDGVRALSDFDGRHTTGKTVVRIG
jgi:hypothetical protein